MNYHTFKLIYEYLDEQSYIFMI